MKKTRFLISFALILFTAFAWFTNTRDRVNNTAAFREATEAGDTYLSGQLYQKAIASYEEALSIQENPQVRSKWVQAYKSAYESGFVTAKEYAAALSEAISAEPDREAYYFANMQVYLDQGNTEGARSVYKKAVKSLPESDTLLDYQRQIMYAYSIERKTYEDAYRSPEGLMTLNHDGDWGIMAEDGSWQEELAYTSISAVSDDGYAIYTDQKGTYLADSDGVVCAMFSDFDYETVLAWGDDLVPVQKEDGSWDYYDCTAGRLTGHSYTRASAYQNGIAAVCSGDSWTLIDTSGDPIQNNIIFSDIKLFSNGDYCYDGVMIAAVGGSYGIYDASGDLTTDLGAADADLYLGSYIAFKNSQGHWGYVDEKGQVMIDPSYSDAHSFSDGLGAVCKGGKWGYIDEEDRIMIDCQYYRAGYFSEDGVALVGVSENVWNVLKLKYS